VGGKAEKTFIDLGRLKPAVAREALSVLIGLPLSDVWHPIFQVFEFGEQRPGKNNRGDDVTFAEWSLHVSCAGQVTRHASVIVASGDMRRNGTGAARRFFDRKTPPKEPEARKRWAAAKEFFAHVKQGSLLVRSVSVSPVGSVTINLSKGFAIRTFTNSAGDWGQWALLHRNSSYSFWVDARADGAIAGKFEPQATEPPPSE
jgi:hypothetical protein